MIKMKEDIIFNKFGDLPSNAQKLFEGLDVNIFWKYGELKSIFDNPNILEIFNLISKNSGLNIKEISKEIKLSYRNTHKHIKHLENLGIVILNKQQNKQGREVVVKLSGININDEIKFLKNKIENHIDYNISKYCMVIKDK